jgi:hypothetical protein
MQGNDIHEEVTGILARMDRSAEQEDQEPEQGIHAGEETAPLQDIYVYIVREHDEELDQPADDGVIETTLAQQKSSLLAIALWFFALLLPLSSIAFQLYLAFNPFIATITIVPKSYQVTLSGTLQLGRLLNPITLSESATAKTTGTGHQNARAATGYITVYNGEFTRVPVPAGTVLTGADGVQIVTDQDATIPAANPPVFGHVTLSAHAAQPGRKGNIPAYDISHACCAPSVLAKNSSSFSGGQDERNFQTVAQADIENAASPLETTLAASSNGALHGQLHPGEKLLLLPCSRAIAPNHQPGQEAIQVTVTVSQTCRAVAYDETVLQATVTPLLTTQAEQRRGAGYRRRGTVAVTITQATVSNNKPFLIFSSHGTWVYAIANATQEQIKALIAGRTKQDAVHLVQSLPGIAGASIAWDEQTKLPNDPRLLRLVLKPGW